MIPWSSDVARPGVSPPCWPRWWRIAVIGLAALILSGCRSARWSGMAWPSGPPSPALPQALADESSVAPPILPQGFVPGYAMPSSALPQVAVTGATPASPFEGTAQEAAGLGAAPSGPWSPPGLATPWPAEEYLADGGDSQQPAGANREGMVLGLEPEDTVAQFDTLDGRTLVVPSNRVHIYSPRFLAVRQVVSLRENAQLDRTSGVYLPEKLAEGAEVLRPESRKQHYQPTGQVGEKSVTIFRAREGQTEVSLALGPKGFQDAFLPFENFRVIRLGQYDEAEMPFLARSARAAVTWTNRQSVRVILEGKTAVALVQNEQVEVIYTVDEPPANPRLRVIKLASTSAARPGESVDFTIRFDNVGNQPIGNVTLLDNLTPRLEYVANSAQASRKAHFSVEPNQVGSLVLRWDFDEPLRPGEGGVVRFRCRVR